jgi:hypothetical protein
MAAPDGSGFTGAAAGEEGRAAQRYMLWDEAWFDYESEHAVKPIAAGGDLRRKPVSGFKPRYRIHAEFRDHARTANFRDPLPSRMRPARAAKADTTQPARYHARKQHWTTPAWVVGAISASVEQETLEDAGTTCANLAWLPRECRALLTYPNNLCLVSAGRHDV